ncbi:hypothetical protein G9A89_017209 [Geosiphon pyriformis]|nr:hypothetical protein G9A89_017209 [Geosiphon pyriformis]
MFLNEFVAAKWFSDLDAMWDTVCKTIVLSAEGTLDSVGALSVKSLFLFGSGFDTIHSKLSKTRKSYCSSKLMKSKCAKEFHIRQAVKRRMESFEVDKDHTIKSVLEHSFCKVVLNHLVVGEKLVLEPGLVKSKVDVIIKGWTQKHVVVSDISDIWVCQFQPLEYVFDGIFSNVMCSISFEEMSGVVSNLPNGKAAGLSGITNELWKHCDKVITDFGLTNGYYVHNGLNQGEVFLPLLWHIFYDSLLCEVRRQESMCGYCLISYFVSKTGCVESQSGLTSFLAASAFVDDTIWVGSSQAATQYILDNASEFIRFNNISINNDKTVAIPINCRVVDLVLTVSSLLISIAKKGELHHYLGIFLSSEGLSRPSLAKAHLDVQFFVNLVLKKAISDKQCSLYFSGCDLSLGGSLADAFRFRSGTPMSCVFGEKVFFKCVSFLKHYDIAFMEQLHNWNGVVFAWKTFKHWKKLDFHGPVPFWFDLSVHFFDDITSSSNCSSHVKFLDPPDVCQSFGFGVICNDLSNASADCFSVYMDGSLHNLGTVDMKTGAAVFFEDINSGLGVSVFSLVSFTLMELQAIALALECIPLFHLVDLFSDSQAALDAYVNWIKVKGYSGILSNEHANVLAKNATLSVWCLPHLVSERFLKAGGVASVHHAHWEIGSGLQVVLVSLHANIDWLRFSLVWHPDSYLALGFTSRHTVGLWTYFMKALHYWLPVAVQKCLYDRCYVSVVCLFCDDIEVSDHIFSCPFDAAGHAQLFVAHALTWEAHSGLVQFSSCVF